MAELEAQREEQRLQATVRKPADAKAYETVTLSRAERDAASPRPRPSARRSQLNAGRPGPARQASRPAPRPSGCKLAAAAEAEHVKLEATARAEATRNIGQAEADATEAKGLAEGEAVRAKGMAEAEAIKARADALAENQDAVIGQQLAENWPAIVEAAAKPFGDIDQMIVLNGAQGLSDTLAQALSQGVAGLSMARQLLGGASPNSNGNGNGTGKATDKATDRVAVTDGDADDASDGRRGRAHLGLLSR